MRFFRRLSAGKPPFSWFCQENGWDKPLFYSQSCKNCIDFWHKTRYNDYMLCTVGGHASVLGGQ